MDTLTPPSTRPAPEAAAARPAVRPVVLLILDGFGCREDATDNAITRANAPRWRHLVATCPHTSIDASELRVGLPEGQMGNSEVGHLNIGAGRIVYQDYTRIDVAIRDGQFQRNPVLADAVAAAKDGNSTLHVLGLLSPGGVHSHERQIAAMVDMAAGGGASRVAIHAFLDGRDTPPRSAAASLSYIERVCARHPGARVASICGRYYAMDRDQRWERVAPAYALLVDGVAQYRAATAEEGLAAAYARAETDEFVKPTAIVDAAGEPMRMADGDVVVFMNFRADRARQMTRALTDPAFAGFARSRVPKLARFVCLTGYGDEFSKLPVAFAPQTIENSFGEYISRLGLAQLRIAETEKYAHVTYFFNGGTEARYPGEDRVLVPSPRVATYDLQPQMSAVEVTDRLVEAIGSGRYDAIVCNYANGDMVGHTGDFEAARRAIETLDACIGRVVDATRSRGGEVVITADHGNAEQMHDATTGQAHTAHTLNRVPFLYVGRPAAVAPGGALQDIAPTLLALMGLPRPPEMTGHSLVRF
ncbi:MAG TPA: 2,3-bisphosphoglycerate-independent phosphoglycerate mutase [Casimicrobiaceae bacterium]|nr:2,3-bisphosphoglycerate-independent phosphoglycerate mutase [Casimicrobiaceae bacterium]